jgi:predicted urease superfamily metal-dependent hydrolase
VKINLKIRNSGQIRSLSLKAIPKRIEQKRKIKMNTTYILWATAPGDPDWAEQIITETTDKNHLVNAERWAQSCGFRNLRTLEHHTGDKPDFTRIINQI